MGTDDHKSTNVTYLPSAVGTAPARRDIEPEVLEGELVSESEYRMSQREQALERYRGYRHDAIVVGRVAKKVATHDRTKTAVRATVRNVLYVPAGLGVVAKRAWDAKTNSPHMRALRQAELSGEQDRVVELLKLSEQAKQNRHDRHMDWSHAPGRIMLALLKALAGLLGLLLLVGVMLAVADHDIARVMGPILGFLQLVELGAWLIAVSWGPFVLVAPWVVALYLWNLGRTKANMPTWTAPAPSPLQGEARQVVPDEGAIMTALRNLNYAPLTAKIKEGWVPRWDLPPVRDGKPGKGWQAQLQLPQGVTVEEIVKRKKVLAHNLVRLPVEVWPTEPKTRPGVLDLWVADQGILSGPVAPWPLLNDGTCDYFKSVPVGVDIRGTVVNGRLFEANYAIAGMMGSGKTTLIITLLAGAMLDPLVDIDVFVFAENADYDPLKPRLRSLVKGAEPENVEKCMQRLRELFSELGERGRILSDLGVSNNVTRELALKDPRLRPRIMVIDECQNLFLSEHGGEAEELAVKLETTARKYAITLIWATPEPSSDSLPRKMMAITSNKACYAIGDQISNDAVLGTGSYKAGISAVSLEPKTEEGPGDVGTSMCRGFQSRPGLMRTFYILKESLHAVVARALKLREKAGITAAVLTEAIDDDWDLLDDVAAVLEHHPRLRTQEVLTRLTEMDRGRYEKWTFADLKKGLPDSAKPYKTMGNWQVSRDRVREAITDRDEMGSGMSGED